MTVRSLPRLFAAAFAVSLSCEFIAAAQTPKVARKAVNEEGFIKIGGIDQWITIKGDDRKNPVVLFLHGGPGAAMSPVADAWYGGWEKEFTVVQWDQRGAGRTYVKNGPSIEPTMTIERMTDDGIEVSEFMTKHLDKKRIIIDGGSWGSILGIRMALARPDLFYAYVGVAQIVNWQRGLSNSYARVLQMARAAGDQEAISALTKLGPPPWHSIRQWPVFRKWEQAYQAKLVSAPPTAFKISPEYRSPQDPQYAVVDDFNFLHFWGLTLSGPLMNVDLPALGTSFRVPIFIIQGQEDLTASPELTKAYFDSIKAPRKEFYLVPGTGHDPSASELEVVRKVLSEQVRPLAVER